jgi:hypothetical protein
MNRLLAASLSIFLFASLGFSQSQMSSGDIKGRIADSSGAVLPNASVAITNIDTGVERRTTADSSGDYRFFVLPPAFYELSVEAPGFATYTRRPIQLSIGQTLNLEVSLQPAGIQQAVLVQAEIPILEPEKTQQSDTIREPSH